jgi:hypothetical protein
LDPVAAALDRRPPRPCALLRVSATGKGRLSITGEWGEEGSFRQKVDAPTLVLGDLAREGGRSPRDLVLLMREWSFRNPGLTSWVDDLRVAVGDADLRLTIWDSTPYEVPWELLLLYGSERDQVPSGWLGAVVAVSRWVTPQFEDRRPAEDPSDRATYAVGEVVGSITEDMVGDAATLARFRHSLVEHPRLLRHLKQSNDPVALLYVACHGTYETSITDLRLGEIALPQLTGIRLPGVEHGGSVVLLNACHSGRMVAEKAIGKSTTFGFAEAFLRRGATVVVGATGLIGTTVARRVADDLLAQLAEHPELPVSAALTRARARVAAPLDVDDMTDAQLEFFVYAFMLVAYGHCSGRVHLPAAGDEED